MPSEFDYTVYRACARIPIGKVATYSLLAQMIGMPHAARAVGQALHRNPFAPAVPCHRVIRSDGRIGGFADGSQAKAQLLRAEGIIVAENKVSRVYFCCSRDLGEPMVF